MKICGWSNGGVAPGAHEFLDADPDRRGAGVVVEMRNAVFGHRRLSLEALRRPV